VQALQQAKLCGMTTYAIVGFDGGKSAKIADHVIHANVQDMQISEDIQVIIGHMLMKSLYQAISQYQQDTLDFPSARA
jgi:D-sedoheptulose 7-phosphate isomerase